MNKACPDDKHRVLLCQSQRAVPDKTPFRMVQNPVLRDEFCNEFFEFSAGDFNTTLFLNSGRATARPYTRNETSPNPYSLIPNPTFPNP